MKITPFLASLLLLLFFGTNEVKAQLDEARCYVVIGAFKFERNAARFTERAKENGLNADFQLNTHRKLYYVYSFVSDDRNTAKNELFKVRETHPQYPDSWLYAGDFKGPHIPTSEWIARYETEVDESTLVVDDEDTDSEEEMVDLTENESDESEEEAISEPVPDVGGLWKVYLNAVDATNLKEVAGKFKLYDAERNIEIRDIETHVLTGIEDPNNRTNRVKVVSDIFGYHEIEETFDLDEPLASGGPTIEMLGDTILLNFELQRLRKGDIATLWKVYFYIDAAIMKEESIYELNQLLDMMKSNPNLKVKIHGHTNGNSFGTVKHLDLDDKEFFTLNGSHEETKASAKKLSLFRAYTIQHWLMDQGIEEDRMEIKGWGGKKMIYDKLSSQADKNVRVEIEILED